MRTQLLLLWLGAMSLAGCATDDAETISGTYQLTALNGAEMPYDHEGLGCCTYLSGTLSFTGRRYTASMSARNRNTLELFTVIEWGQYGRADGAVTFVRDSFQIQPFGFDRGTIFGDSLLVDFGGEGPGSDDQLSAIFVQ